MDALLSKNFFIVLTIIVVVGLGGLYWWNTMSSFGATLVVEPAAFVQSVTVEGTVQSAQNVELGFNQSGTISAVYAKIGDTVTAGTKLAEINSSDLQAAVAQKEAALQ